MISGVIYGIKKLLKKPFKVGIITYHYPGENAVNSGVGVHAYHLSRELTALGCEVHVFCHGKRKSTKRYHMGEGKLVVRRIATKTPAVTEDAVLSKYLSDFIFDHKTMEEVVKESSKEEFDIVHSNGGLIGGMFVSKYLGNIHWINTIHSLEKRRLKFMSKEKKKYLNIFKWVESTITHADANIAVSKNLKQAILEDYENVKEEKVFYIPNGVDTKTFYRDNSIAEQKKILYVGRFSLEKGIDYLPKIINAVLYHNKELTFEVVASDSIVSDSLQKVKKQFELIKKKYPDRFIWTKELVSAEDLAKKYNESMIVIQPSRYESFGLAALEAITCGKAVIVSDKGALGEVIGNAGVVVPLTVSAFVEEISKLSKDPKLRERFGRRGIERAKEFTWPSIAKQTLELYKVISGKTNEEENKKQPHEKVHEGLQNLDELHKKENKSHPQERK